MKLLKKLMKEEQQILVIRQELESMKLLNKLKRRAEDLRNKARAKIHETPEQAHERREANLRNVTRHRANQTAANIQEKINANSRIEEMVSIPQFSEFVEVMDS
jgi:hypothetical protein